MSDRNITTSVGQLLCNLVKCSPKQHSTYARFYVFVLLMFASVPRALTGTKSKLNKCCIHRHRKYRQRMLHWHVLIEPAVQQLIKKRFRCYRPSAIHCSW
uniref:Uncharacterized protein n=1 Tax=Hyaloperonospora arabidopsidis (strain Emoy2) TaxID=559515 RepID=M4BVN5_HYAAE